MRVLVWIAVAILIAIFVVIGLARLVLDIFGTHDPPESDDVN
jgi:hypothetical protein